MTRHTSYRNYNKSLFFEKKDRMKGFKQKIKSDENLPALHGNSFSSSSDNGNLQSNY
jgi:hypothetical protein